MNPNVKLAFHESAHAYVTHQFDRKVQRIAISPFGGFVDGGPLSADHSDEELEKGLAIVYAGEAGEAVAPHPRMVEPRSNGGLTISELEALALVDEVLDTAPDAELIAYAEERLGPERAAKARRLAWELVERGTTLGFIPRIADALMLHGVLDADDIEDLIAMGPQVEWS